MKLSFKLVAVLSAILFYTDTNAKYDRGLKVTSAINHKFFSHYPSKESKIITSAPLFKGNFKASNPEDSYSKRKPLLHAFVSNRAAKAELMDADNHNNNEKKLSASAFENSAFDLADRFDGSSIAMSAGQLDHPKLEVSGFGSFIDVPEHQHLGFEMIKFGNNKVNQTKKILFISVHGTFSSPNSFGHDPSRGTSAALIDSAKALAEENDCLVDLLVYKWSGALDKEHRLEAGKKLAQKIEQLRTSDPHITKIIGYAHSHGCNVMNNMAPHLEQPIDEAFYAAPIELDTTESAAQNVYYFWGSHDVTQAAGDLETTKGSLIVDLILICTAGYRCIVYI